MLGPGCQGRQLTALGHSRGDPEAAEGVQANQKPSPALMQLAPSIVPPMDPRPQYPCHCNLDPPTLPGRLDSRDTRSPLMRCWTQVGWRAGPMANWTPSMVTRWLVPVFHLHRHSSHRSVSWNSSVHRTPSIMISSLEIVSHSSCMIVQCRAIPDNDTGDVLWCLPLTEPMKVMINVSDSHHSEPPQTRLELES